MAELRQRKYGEFWVWALSILVFAIYHWTFGRSWVSLVVYIPLGIIFTWVKERYGVVSSIGVHFAWDLFILGFLI
jgi:membrane protease YdiL (CAAX protease family)